jgi:hypothetical protein
MEKKIAQLTEELERCPKAFGGCHEGEGKLARQRLIKRWY